MNPLKTKNTICLKVWHILRISILHPVLTGAVSVHYTFSKIN